MPAACFQESDEIGDHDRVVLRCSSSAKGACKFGWQLWFEINMSRTIALFWHAARSGGGRTDQERAAELALELTNLAGFNLM